jgi:Spy/CpxP family protein refolding chaperone
MNQPWKVIVVLVGIFAAGGVTGGFVTLRFCKNKLVNRPVPEEWAPRTLKRLADHLDLTPEQKDQIMPIVKRHMEQLNRLRNTSMAETQTVVEGMQREISAKLTPEQREKYEKLNRELREAREKNERERRAKAERELLGKPGEKPPGDRPPPKPPGN